MRRTRFATAAHGCGARAPSIASLILRTLATPVRRALAPILAAKGVAADAPITERRAAVADHAQGTFLHNKIQAALFFGLRLVPPAVAQAVAVEAGERAAMEAML